MASRNRWLDWAVRVALVLVISALAFLAYTVWQGEQRVRQGSLSSRAITNLRESVRKDPKNASLRVLLGDALRDTGSYKDAIEQYKTALELEKDHPGALSGLALVAMAQEEWETASGYWQRAIDVLSKMRFAAQDLRLEKAYYYYGVTLIQLGEYEEAVANLKEALRIKRSDADTHYALSVAYGKLGLTRNQRQSLETALAFVPSMPEANYDLGLILLAEGDEAGAAELFRRAADNAPGRPEPLDELDKLGPFQDRYQAAVDLQATDPAAALKQARIAFALDPKNVDAARLVARLVQQSGKTDDAVAAWERVLQLAPDDEEATAALAALRKK